VDAGDAGSARTPWITSTAISTPAVLASSSPSRPRIRANELIGVAIAVSGGGRRVFAARPIE
jgi:hypothetical protein